MDKFKLQLAELIIQFLTGVFTVILQPPLPLLAIPFLIIITTRTIMFKLEVKGVNNGS